MNFSAVMTSPAPVGKFGRTRKTAAKIGHEENPSLDIALLRRKV